MSEPETSKTSLPNSVTAITIDNKKIYIVGTAHVSKQSVKDVETTIALVNPDTICVELCESRYKSMKDKDLWKKMDIFRVVKEKKTVFLLAQLIMGSFYRKLGEQLDVPPGAEMLKGIELSESMNKQLVLADRNIEVTLRRVWAGLSFWGKMKMMSQMLGSLFVSEEIDGSMVESLKQDDQLEKMMEEFSKGFPGVRSRLIDERDIYLAEKIRTAPGETIVAVVGAGHVKGMLECIKTPHDLTEITKIPAPSIWPSIIGWGISASIIALFVIGFFTGGAEKSIHSIYIWILVTGTFAAIGTAIALGHPLAILTAFVAAPITTIHPLLAAGWFAGLTQAFLKKPTVEDMENLKTAFDSLKGFWGNSFCRVLLVVIMANLGSSIGTFVAGSWIIKELF